MLEMSLKMMTGHRPTLTASMPRGSEESGTRQAWGVSERPTGCNETRRSRCTPMPEARTACQLLLLVSI